MAGRKKKNAQPPPEAAPEQPPPSLPNHDTEAMKEYIDRWTSIEIARIEANTEAKDLVKDLKTEIKTVSAEKGLDIGEISRLVKIRVEEAEARRRAEELKGDLVTYESLYGKADPIDDDDPGL